MIYLILFLLILFYIKKKNLSSFNSNSPCQTQKTNKNTGKFSEELSAAEKTSLYFDMRMNLVLKKIFGTDMVRWEYANPDVLHYRTKENDVIVFLNDGSSKTETIFTESVWGTRIEDESVDDTDNSFSPAQEWIMKHSGEIEKTIDDAMANTGGVETVYLLKEDAKGIEQEIISLLAKNSPHAISLDGNKLIINYQAARMADIEF